MKNRYQKISSTLGLVLLAVLFNVNCSKQSFSLDGTNESFSQDPTYSDQVDLLMVVDNSSSMAQHQQLLGAQIPPFVDALEQSKLNYHIAVVTTDFSGSGEQGRFLTTGGNPSPILTLDTPNIRNVLAGRVQAGEMGSNVEQGLRALKSSLSAPLSSGWNNGFIRPNALLVVMVLSNEEDQSPSDDYQGFLDALKPALPLAGRSWIMNFMGVVRTDLSCQTSQWFNAFGDKYVNLVNSSTGTAESICNANFVSALTNVKKRILEVLTEYRLDTLPNVSTLQVLVNNVVVVQDSVNGWTYDETRNSISFHGSAIPPIDSSVKVNYTPKGLK